MTFPNPGVVLVTGIMAAGKSTVAQGLAERLPKSVHLRGDVFRRMVVNARASMDADMNAAAMKQLTMRYQIAAAAADIYCQNGFTVVYQDVIVGPLLADVIEQFKKWPLHVVVLCPSPQVAGLRDAARDKTGYGHGWTPQMLDDGLRQNTPRIGLWLDNSTLTVEETLDTVFARSAETRTGLS